MVQSCCFTTRGAHGGPGAVPYDHVGNTRLSVLGPKGPRLVADGLVTSSVTVYQAGTSVVVFSLDMNSLACHIMAGAVNPLLLPMY